MDQRLAPLRGLLVEATGGEVGEVEEMSATELRDALLVLDPLKKEWVARVNQAEAEYWKGRSGGGRGRWGWGWGGFAGGGGY